MSIQVMKVDGGAEGIKNMKVDYPSNSLKAKGAQTSEKKVTQVTTGLVIAKKKSLGKRFKETFLGENMDNVVGYIIQDVLIPAAKSTISDIVSGGIEMLLFGTSKGRRTNTYNRNDSRVSYQKYYKENERKDGRRDITVAARARHNFDDIIIASRAEAEEVRNNLVDLIADYQVATVSDLYDLVGITSEFTDNKYGWDDLSTSKIIRVRDGYLIDLPKPVVIN